MPLQTQPQVTARGRSTPQSQSEYSKIDKACIFYKYMIWQEMLSTFLAGWSKSNFTNRCIICYSQESKTVCGYSCYRHWLSVPRHSVFLVFARFVAPNVLWNIPQVYIFKMHVVPLKFSEISIFNCSLSQLSTWTVHGFRREANPWAVYHPTWSCSQPFLRNSAWCTQ